MKDNDCYRQTNRTIEEEIIIQRVISNRCIMN